MLPGQLLDFCHEEDVYFNRASQAAFMAHADYSACPAGGNRAAGGRLGQQVRTLRPSRKW